MRVNGQLRYAQLQNLTVAPTNTPLGLIYADIANPAAALPKFFDGSTIKTLAFTSSTATGIYDAGNSGTAKTIDWTLGTRQRINLTAPCQITFGSSGLVDGTYYTLIIESMNTTPLTTYFYRFTNDINTLGKAKAPVPMQTNEIRVHQFLYRAATPSTLTTANMGTFGSLSDFSGGSGSAFCIDVMTPYGDDTRRILTGGTGGTNQINSWLARRINGQVMYGYNRITTSFTSGTSYAVAYSPSGVMTAWAVAASPYFYVTAWNADMGGTSFMTLPNPGTIPTGVGRSVSWHPSEQAVAVAHTTSPSVSVYPVNLPTTTTGVSGFGTKYANPAILPAGDGASVAFSPMGDFLAVASYSSPFIQVYPFDLSTGFGPKVADPAVLPTGGPHTYARIIAWRPQGDWIAMGLPNSPYLYLVPFNRATASFGIPVTLSGSNLPTTAISVVQFSPCGNYLLVGGVGGRGLDIYPFDAAAGILNASPTTFPATVTDQWRDAVFDRDGRTIYAVTSGSYVRTFTMPYRSQNWIRTNDV